MPVILLLAVLPGEPMASEKPAEMILGLCPECGCELLMKLRQVSTLAGIPNYGYVVPVHPQPVSLYYDLCPRGNTPVDPVVGTAVVLD